MTRGHPPYVAIGEAQRRATWLGMLVLALEPAGELPFHFVTCFGNRISLARVRRLKLPGYTIAEIEHSCRNDIAALRSIAVTAEILRELWVRGPDRHWYRYLVLPDCLMVINDGKKEEAKGDTEQREGKDREEEEKKQEDGIALQERDTTLREEVNGKEKEAGDTEETPGAGQE